jgi:anaerobic dimethyl sulfoxide reductase subunit C (anchor subunit)
MNVREWALITFTVLAQLSVGSFWVLGIVHTFALRQAGEAEADRLSDRALVAIWLTLLLGLAASLLHLGNPINAWRAVANLGTSWLSREIASGVVFAGLGGLFALMQWRKLGSFRVRNLVAVAAGVVGLFLVYAMSMVYMLPAEPGWNVATTPFSFFTTTFLLGVLAMGAAFVANYAYVQRQTPAQTETQLRLLRGAMQWIAVASIVLLGAQFVLLPVNVAFLAGGAGAAAVPLLVTQYGLVFGLRLGLVFLGAGILGVFLFQAAMNPGREQRLANLAYAAFAAVLVSEVLGRFLFYATQVKIAM